MTTPAIQHRPNLVDMRPDEFTLADIARLQEVHRRVVKKSNQRRIALRQLNRAMAAAHWEITQRRVHGLERLIEAMNAEGAARERGVS